MSIKKNPKDFTLGADPEFVAMKRGPTSNQIYDASEYDNSFFNNPSFGFDGGGLLLEVRPDPSPNPFDLIANIRQIMICELMQNKPIQNYHWLAGSYHKCSTRMSQGEEEAWKLPMGGHIHFGLHCRTISSEKAARILSQYLGLCSCLIEDAKQGLSRRREGYGAFGDIRAQKHGFEYRTPSSWLVSPYISASTLCLAKTVMYEAINNPSFEPRDYINPIDIQTMNRTKMKRKFPAAWRQITEMHLYPLYKAHIDIIHWLVKNNLSWIPTCSMKEAWGIKDINNAPQKQISLKDIWKQHIEQTSCND